MSSSATNNRRRLLQIQQKNFAHQKQQCLAKRDKSSAGRIDARAEVICAVLNALPQYYTTSSCAGRCFLYRGAGNKSNDNAFERWRVSHDPITDAERYFDLSTLAEDPTGGGDSLRLEQEDMNGNNAGIRSSGDVNSGREAYANRAIWLRFEPFILHVACRSLRAAHDLVTVARPTFKNVGLTTWRQTDDSPSQQRFVVAIWGDEGLEMPLCMPNGDSVLPLSSSSQDLSLSQWLADLVNERHERNWSKIQQFVQAAREQLQPDLDPDFALDHDHPLEDQSLPSNHVPRSFDMIGDVALLHSLSVQTKAEQQAVGQVILQKNTAIKIVALRTSNLVGTQRAPGDEGLVILAGPERSPLITTHCEYGIKCVVDLEQTFFSPRMAQERYRICRQVARGEHVLVLFAGVGMEALQIAGRTEASSVTAIELGTVATECARRGHRMLERNKAAVTCSFGSAAERLTILQGDVLDILPTLPKHHYDRILAPRPKEGDKDGDLGSGDGGITFLNALLPVLKQEKGQCHWYDFVADHEFPACERTRRLLESCCTAHGLDADILHVANVGSVAMRQLRVCVDFRISVKESNS